MISTDKITEIFYLIDEFRDQTTLGSGGLYFL